MLPWWPPIVSCPRMFNLSSNVHCCLTPPNVLWVVMYAPKEVWLDWVSKWRMQHQRLMPAGNIELFNHLFLPSAVIAVSNIKLKCFFLKYGIFQSDLLIVWFTALHNLRAHLDINLLNRVTMIEKCIFASMTRYTVRYSALNHFDMKRPPK